jgi:uncharacterized protein (DUF952 family)
VDVNLRYERPVSPVEESERDTSFPHLYGALPLAAVAGFVRWTPAADGRFRFPAAYDASD